MVAGSSPAGPTNGQQKRLPHGLSCHRFPLSNFPCRKHFGPLPNCNYSLNLCLTHCACSAPRISAGTAAGCRISSHRKSQPFWLATGTLERRRPPGRQRLGAMHLRTPLNQPPSLVDCARRVAASKTFSRAEQLQRLLLYLCDGDAGGEPDRYSERSIATHVFNRRNFDPHNDTIVRTQMMRLRRKLNEYYETEGVQDPCEIRFDRNSYRPVMASAKVRLAGGADHPIRPDHRLALGVLTGAFTATVCLLSLYLFLRPTAVDPYVAKHPVWQPFRGVTVDLATSTPLFFRSAEGFERVYGLNLPSDLAGAPRLLRRWPAAAQWDYWTAFSDSVAAAHLARFLTLIGASPRILSARDVSSADLGTRNVIIIGHPRGAPALLEALKTMPLRPREHHAGEAMADILNANPRPGESSVYQLHQGSGLDNFHEDAVDYALLTMTRSKYGTTFLSVFGTKVQSASFVVERLLEPTSLRTLYEKLPKLRTEVWTNLQVLFKVEYSKAHPTGMAAVATRLY